MTRQPSLEELRAEAHYQRDRYALYRARALTGKATSSTRMRALERAASGAQARLERAAALMPRAARPRTPGR